MRFKAKEYEAAAITWGEALACLRAAKAPDGVAAVRTNRLSWHNNRAAALLQCRLWADAEAAATEALALEGTNLKALYRRGSARAEAAAAMAAAAPAVHEAREAKLQGAARDFEKVVTASPANAKAQTALEAARAALAELRSSAAAAAIEEAEAAAALAAALEQEKEKERAAAAVKLATMSAEEQETARKEAEKKYWCDLLVPASRLRHCSLFTVGVVRLVRRDEKMAEMAKSAPAPAPAAEWTVEPKFTVGSGSGANELEVMVELPKAKNLKGFDIELSDDGDELRVVGKGYKLVLALPVDVDVETVRAKFDKKEKVLRVTAEKIEEIATSSMR
eukprot:SAG11_NODE_2162_length_3729_cov_1.561433_4_plen_335_part_00